MFQIAKKYKNLENLLKYPEVTPLPSVAGAHNRAGSGVTLGYLGRFWRFLCFLAIWAILAQSGFQRFSKVQNHRDVPMIFDFWISWKSTWGQNGPNRQEVPKIPKSTKPPRSVKISKSAQVPQNRSSPLFVVSAHNRGEGRGSASHRPASPPARQPAGCPARKLANPPANWLPSPPARQSAGHPAGQPASQMAVQSASSSARPRKIL